MAFQRSTPQSPAPPPALLQGTAPRPNTLHQLVGKGVLSKATPEQIGRLLQSLKGKS